MAKSFAIHLHDEGALALRVDGSAKGATIGKVAELRYLEEVPAEDELPPTESERRETRLAQLKKWLKREGMASGPLTLYIENRDVILRDMKIDFTDRKQIDKIITFQVEGVIPSTPIEDLSVGYNVLSSNENGSMLLVAAAHRRPIERQLDDLADIRISPAAADSGVGGALNLRKLCPDLASAETPTLWIDFQDVHALVSVLEGENIVRMRTLRVPGAAALELRAAGSAVSEAESDDAESGEALEGDASLQPIGDDDESGEALQESAEDSAAEASEASQDEESEPKLELEDDAHTPPAHLPPMAPKRLTPGEYDSTGIYRYDAGIPQAEALIRLLTIEARRLLVATPTDEPITRIVLTGVPKSLHRPLSALKREIGVESVEFVDLLEPLIARDKSGQPKFELPRTPLLAPLAGVALKGLGIDGSEVDFLTGDLSPIDTFDEIKVPIVSGLVIACLLAFFGLVVINNYKKSQVATRTTMATGKPSGFLEFNNGMKDVHDTAFKEYPESLGDAPKFLNGENPNNLSMRDIVLKEHKLLKDTIDDIRGGKKTSYPPVFESTKIYQAFLNALALSFERKGAVPREAINFQLMRFEFSQITRDGKTTGKLRLDAWMESGMNVQMKNAIAAIQIPNPAWDGKDASLQMIKPFIEVSDSAGNETRKRGQRGGPGGSPVDIYIKKYSFTADTLELERKVEEGGKKGGLRDLS